MKIELLFLIGLLSFCGTKILKPLSRSLSLTPATESMVITSSDTALKKTEDRARIASVFFMFRHGARTPTHFVPAGFIARNFTQPGMLTSLGGQQLRALGEEAVSRYSFFQAKEVVFICSFRERNIDSMTNFTVPFPFPEKRTFYTKKESDFLFHSQYFDENFKAKRGEVADQNQVHIDQLFDLAMAHNGGELLRKYNPDYKNETSYDKLDALSHLYTSLRCNEVNQIDDEFKLNPILRKALEYSFSFQMYKVNYHKMNFRKRRTNELLILLGKQLLSMIKPFEKYSALYFQHNTKFSHTYYEVDPAMFLSCHDTNVMGMLSVFLDSDELLNNNFYIPEFAGYISFELIDTNDKDYFVDLGQGIDGDVKEPTFVVKIEYDHLEIFPKQCHGQRCSLEQFVAILDDNSSDCHSHDCIQDIQLDVWGHLKN
jgi:hypothetical protein